MTGMLYCLVTTLPITGRQFCIMAGSAALAAISGCCVSVNIILLSYLKKVLGMVSLGGTQVSNLKTYSVVEVVLVKLWVLHSECFHFSLSSV